MMSPRLPETDHVDIQKPGGESPARSVSEEDIPGIQVWVSDAVAVKLVEEFSDGGKKSGPLRGPGAAGEVLHKIQTVGNQRSDHLDPVPGAGRIENHRFDPGSGDFDPRQSLAGPDFAKGPVGAEIKIPGHVSP